MIILDNISNQELLNFAIKRGIIDIDAIQKEIEMAENLKYLEMHNAKIWQSTDQKWYTFLPDFTRKDGKRKLKRNSKEELQKAIIFYYKSIANEPYLEDVFKEWIEQKLQYGEIQKQTYDRYQTDFVRFFKDTSISKMKFKFISEEKLEEFIRKTIHDKQLTAKAWSGLRVLINGIFKYGKKRGYTTISITQFMGDLDLSNKIFKKRVFTDKESVFTDQEVNLIISYILDQEPSIINFGIILAFQTGLRVGELSALQWQDIKQKHLIVNKTEIRYRGDDGNYVYEIRENAKTEAGNRKVFLSNEAIYTLQRIKFLNPSGEYLFMKNGKRIKEKAFTTKIVKICKYINIQPRSMHKARKTYATKLLNANLDENLILNQVGHIDISTTKKYYQFNNREEEEIRKIIQGALNS